MFKKSIQQAEHERSTRWPAPLPSSAAASSSDASCSCRTVWKHDRHNATQHLSARQSQYRWLNSSHHHLHMLLRHARTHKLPSIMGPRSHNRTSNPGTVRPAYSYKSRMALSRGMCGLLSQSNLCHHMCHM